MENFTSVFELLAAFNFALVISNDFLVAVNIKIVGYLGGIRSKAKNVENVLIEEVKRYITVSLKEKDVDARTKERLTAEDTKCEELLQKLNVVNQEIKSIENKLSFSTNFTSYSLFSGIYCVLVLVISGFDNQYNNSCSVSTKILINEFFTTINFLFIIILFSSIKLKKKNLFRRMIVWFGDFSLRNVIYVFMLASGFSAILSLIIHAILNKSCTVDLYNFNIILCLLIPSMHFIFGFFRALMNNNVEIEQLNKMILPLEIEANGFKERVQGIEGVDIREFLSQQTNNQGS